MDNVLALTGLSDHTVKNRRSDRGAGVVKGRIFQIHRPQFDLRKSLVVWARHKESCRIVRLFLPRPSRAIRPYRKIRRSDRGAGRHSEKGIRYAAPKSDVQGKRFVGFPEGVVKGRTNLIHRPQFDLRKSFLVLELPPKFYTCGMAQPSARGSDPAHSTPVCESRRMIWPRPNMARDIPLTCSTG